MIRILSVLLVALFAMDAAAQSSLSELERRRLPTDEVIYYNFTSQDTAGVHKLGPAFGDASLDFEFDASFDASLFACGAGGDSDADGSLTDENDCEFLVDLDTADKTLTSMKAKKAYYVLDIDNAGQAAMTIRKNQAAGISSILEQKSVTFTYQGSSAASQDWLVALENPSGSGVNMIITKVGGVPTTGSDGLLFAWGAGDPVTDGFASSALDLGAVLDFNNADLGNSVAHWWVHSGTNTITPANASKSYVIYGAGHADEWFSLDLTDTPIILLPGEWIGVFPNASAATPVGMANVAANVLINYIEVPE